VTVLFYISGHGFGHASREVEIINALGHRSPGIRIIVRSAVSRSLLERTVQVPYELRPGACDSGIVQATSVSHDDDATIRAAVAFYSTLDARIHADAAAFARDQIDLIVADIPPLAFEVAAQLSVPSIGIANFTWDWIYETHPGLTAAAPWLVPRIRQAYRKATLALELPFAGGLDVFPAVRALPLVARRPSRGRDETRRHFGVPLDRRAALLSFGGYGMPGLNVQAIDATEWTLVATDRVLRDAPRLPHLVHVDEHRFLGAGFRYEDLVAAVDVVVTKPGFGIVAECLANKTAMLYTSRGRFAEYDVMVAELPRFLKCEFVPQPDMLAGRWREPLRRLMNQPEPPEHPRTDGAEVVADMICERLLSSDSH
jgi:UDP:flavonoid glycosyltransferase YjiC (YdhE family)